MKPIIKAKRDDDLDLLLRICQAKAERDDQDRPSLKMDDGYFEFCED